MRSSSTHDLCGRFWRGVLLMIVSTVLCAAAPVTAEVRTWTDSTGKQKTEAEFVSFKDGKVTLRKPGTDKTVTLSIDRLSDEDQLYVEDLVDALEDAASERERAEAAAAAAEDEADAAEEEEADADEDDDDADERVASATNRKRSTPNNVINSVRGAAFRTQTTNQLKNITLGMINLYQAKGRFPAAATGRGNKPGLSWRVAILPYIDENALYRQFRQNEPWDSDHNSKLIPRMPKVFKSPGANLDPGFTNFLAIVNDRSIIVPAGMRGIKMNNVRDGTSKTMMLVEADDTHAAIWTKPDDYAWDVSNPLEGLGHIWPGYFMASFADGHVSRVPSSLEADELNGLMTRDGGERVTLP